MHGAFLEFLCRNWSSCRPETGVSRNLWICLKEVKPLVVYDGELGVTLEPMQGIAGHLMFIWATLSYFTFVQ